MLAKFSRRFRQPIGGWTLAALGRLLEREMALKMRYIGAMHAASADAASLVGSLTNVAGYFHTAPPCFT